jgi:riboflavin synthase
MFTGIIQGMGVIRNLTRRGADASLEVETDLSLDDVALGDSIAVDGACLTVTAKTARTFKADVSAETLSRTTLGAARVGGEANLEKALRLGDFLGGHLVLGHVDGIGRIAARTVRDSSLLIGVDLDASLMRYVVEKGSVAVDGVSLTVNRCEKTRFYVNTIPHTAAATTLGRKRTGEAVNIETDIIGKYVERLAAPYTGPAPAVGGLSRDLLSRHGFIK